MANVIVENFHLYSFQIFSSNTNKNVTMKNMQTQGYLKARRLTEGYWLALEIKSFLDLWKATNEIWDLVKVN